MHQHHPIARGIGLGLLLAGTTAHADDTTPALKTVTVTAQHREESLQQVPVAVSAVQGTSITADGVRAMGDITTFIPNAAAKNPDGDGRPRWYIRGLGTGDTGAATVYPVGIYADDVYLNAPVAGGGTLVDERLAGRVSLYSEERDGFTHNLSNHQTYGDVNKKAVRVQFLAKLNPDLAALWKLHGRQFKGDGSSGSLPLGTYYNVGYQRPEGRRIELNVDENAKLDHDGTSLTLNGDIGDYTLTSISAYDYIRQQSVSDADYTPFEVNGASHTDNRYDQYSQELRLASPQQETLRWMLGSHYFHETLDSSDRRLVTPGPTPNGTGSNQIGGVSLSDLDYTHKTDSYALFGNLAVDVTDDFTVTGGLRWTTEKKTIDLGLAQLTRTSANGPLVPLGAAGSNGSRDKSKRWDAWTYDVTPEYRINDNLRVFFRYAHGFRSGGFNTGLSSNLAQLTTVDPEQLDAYELGLKSEWLDHRLTVNANLFYYDYQDIQVNLLTVNSGVLTTALTNGAKGKVKGAELEIEGQPTDNLHLRAAVSFLDTEYTDFKNTNPTTGAVTADYSANSFVRSPRNVVSLGADYTIALVIGSLAVPVVHAQNGPSADDKLDTVVVVGTRRSDVTALESAAPVDVLSAEKLQDTGATDLSGALTALSPSFSFPQSPQGAFAGSIAQGASLRGLASDQVLVLVNGKRRHTSANVTRQGLANGRGAAAVDLSLIPLSAVSRVEILRDGAAAQYGSDAIAGVINIVLKENDNGGNLGYRFGGYDKGDGLQRKLSGWKGLALGLGQRVRPVQPGGQQRGRPGRRLHRLRLCHLCTQEHRRRRLLRPAHHADPQLRQRRAAALPRRAPADHSLQPSGLCPDRRGALRGRHPGHVRPRRQLWQRHTQVHRPQRHQPELGRRPIPGYYSGITNVDAASLEHKVFGAYVDLEGQLTEKFQAGVAVRSEHYSDFGDTTNGKLSLRYDFTPQIAARGSISSGYRAPSLVQSGLSSFSVQVVEQPPGSGNWVEVQQRTLRADSPEAALLGGRALKPEESTNYSLGLVWRPLANASVTLDAYRIDIDNRITLSDQLPAGVVGPIFAGTPYANIQSAAFYTNIADTRTEGVELAGQYQWDLQQFGRLDLSAGFAKTRTRITELRDAGGIAGEQIVGRATQGLIEHGTPDSKLTLSAHWLYQNWGVTLTQRRYGEWQSLNASNPDLDQTFSAQWVTDLDLSYRFDQGLKLSVGAINLFDSHPDTLDGQTLYGVQKYSITSPEGAQGAFYYTSLSYDF